MEPIMVEENDKFNSKVLWDDEIILQRDMMYFIWERKH